MTWALLPNYLRLVGHSSSQAVLLKFCNMHNLANLVFTNWLKIFCSMHQRQKVSGSSKFEPNASGILHLERDISGQGIISFGLPVSSQLGINMVQLKHGITQGYLYIIWHGISMQVSIAMAWDCHESDICASGGCTSRSLSLFTGLAVEIQFIQGMYLPILWALAPHCPAVLLACCLARKCTSTGI